ncbi:MAG: calcium-translocating P-type ATPase, PMCA-type [Oscillospiraceae bacterium]|nr:calcium-translocating P-type ATPase, PMCA-type [Oscillospiraceae bacterium]
MEIHHNKTINETAAAFGTDIKTGLTTEEAKRRLGIYGKNELIQKKKKNIVIKFFEQFNDFMIIILLAAAAVSFITSLMQGDADITEPVIILAIVVLNALLGVIQERRAEKSLEALKKLSSPHACVMRSSNMLTIDASDVVPGDILIISAGDLVAADCRLITSNNLTIDESSLTGESLSAEKDASLILDEYAPLGDRKNIILSSTSVTGGKGTAIVTGTGMNTEVGRIANMLLTDETEQTPLQRKLADTGKTLGIAALMICLAVFIMGLFRHLPPFDMFMTAVSLAVAAIPEGLPAIVTIMLAIGVMRMSKRNAIVRNLPSVETLGSASVICSDKTGTLTQNKMTVATVYTTDEKMLYRLCTMCCDSDEGHKNPTESALLSASKKMGFDKAALDKKYRRIDEIPFDSTRKRMTTMHRDIKGYKTIVKGALEFVLPLCKNYYNGQKVLPLSNSTRRKILSENSKMAAGGLRVIAVCYRDDYLKTQINEENMTFIGLIGIEDPPRVEAADAVAQCKRAGIRPVMITGDHAATALSIAKRIGIADSDSEVITGDKLDKISDDELTQNINNYSVFARVTPSHKMKIIKAFKANGEIVAMTGDGVNDAPALSAADIGCSMGITGTDVAKSASDMVLTDDNFATIVYAVHEGRSIFANIKKAVQFLLSSNIGEILTVFMGIIFGWSSPLTAIQLLWVNLVTDSLPAIALGLDAPEDDIMDKKPRSPKKGLFADGLWASIIFEGLMIGALALLAFSIGANLFGGLIAGRTMAFAVLSISQLVHAFNMRSEHSVIMAGLFKNPYLILSFIVGLLLEVSVISVPRLAVIFGVVQLSFPGWVIVAALSFMPIVIVEAQKAVTDKIFRKRS